MTARRDEQPEAAGSGGPARGAGDQGLLDLGARHPTPIMRASLLVGRTIYRAITRVDMGPLDGLPTEGPLIIASNHLSNADPPLIASWLTPALGRAVHWMAKQEALDWPIAGPFLKANGAFGIRRGAADTDAFRLAKRVLDDGRVLGTFPEGRRSHTGALERGKEGVALLAIRTGAPILPVAVWGTERLWPVGNTFPHPGGRVHLRVGPPFVLDRRTVDGKREDLPAVADRLMEGIAILLPPAYRGVYGEVAPEGEDAGPVA
ncbi:MAG: 1-acyl-sn-glycerol-3-phosphate acyltransferase [Chloroflexi bacterium]|nr:1-acyl-sn-glycerol-3-phosphate acyltransferase [Chloroflexota bacterium]